MEKIIHIYFSKKLIVLYLFLAIILIPWIFSLWVNLPSHHLVRHWDALWVGFDIMLLITLLVTMYFAATQKVWVMISATALAIMYIVDGWFDLMTARPGKEFKTALLFDSLEFLLAIFTLRVVYRIVKEVAIQEENIKFKPHSK